MRGMIKWFFDWAGLPGAIIVGLLLAGTIGSAATIWIGAPMWVIPFFDLLAELLMPFPTVASYAATGLLAFAVLRLASGLFVRRPEATPWVAGILTVVALAVTGFCLPMYWNAAAGLTTTSVHAMPQPITLPKGSEIALIEWGEPSSVHCNGLCLSLLLEGQARAVEMAATQREPGSLAVLPAKRFTLTPQTRTCLTGIRDYALPGDNTTERHDEFKLGLPIEYDKVPFAARYSLSIQARLSAPRRRDRFLRRQRLQGQQPPQARDPWRSSLARRYS